MKKKTAIMIKCASLMLVFVFMFCFCVIFPRTQESDNSILVEFPELTAKTFLSGEYFSDLSAWFTDTIFLRDKFVDMNSHIRGLMGITPKEQIFNNGPVTPDEEWDPEEEWDPDEEWDPSEDIDHGVTTTPIEDPAQTNAPSDESTTPDDDKPSHETDAPATIPVITQAEKPVEVVNEVLIIGTRALEIYHGGEKSAAQFAQLLNTFANKVGNDVNVYSMVIPKACAYYISESKDYAHYAGNSLRDINVISGNLSNRVTDVPVYYVLEQHKNEDIYFRTDHHWTGLGAYYASQQFASVAGVDFADLSTYTVNVRPGYIGTMYKYTNYSPTLLNNPEDFVTHIPRATYTATFYDQQLGGGRVHDIYWYVKDEKRSSWYSTYLAGDAYSVHIKSNACNNGRKLLIVKDSYGNALAPYLLESFEEIYIVDGRTFELSLPAMVKEKNITDVLFAQCAFSAVGSYRDNLGAMMN